MPGTLWSMGSVCIVYSVLEEKDTLPLASEQPLPEYSGLEVQLRDGFWS